jgi:hypothetical protein
MTRARDANKKPIDPQITVGDTIVKVGALSWGGIKSIRDRIKQSQLELPRLEFAGGPKNLGLLTLNDFADFFQRNVSVFAGWLATSPELIDVLIVDGSNISDESVNQLSAAEAFAVAKAVVDASLRDGLYESSALFFAGLLGPLFTAQTTTSAPEDQASSDATEVAAGASTTSTD